MRRAFPLIVAILCHTAAAHADHVQVRVTADHAAAKPGDTVGLALTLTVDPHWHVYWQNPGDTGSPPKLRWSKPTAGVADFQFPVPTRLDVGNGLTAFGYEKQVTLLTRVTVPADAHGSVEFAGTLSCVVCENECVLEKHPVSVSVAVGPTKLADMDQFMTWRAALPLAAGNESEAVFSPDGRDGRLEYELPAGGTGVDFFPPKIDGLTFGKPETCQSGGRQVYRIPFKVLPGPAIDVRANGIVLTRAAAGETAAQAVNYHVMTGPHASAVPNP